MDLVQCQTVEDLWHIAFYKFAPVQDPEALRATLEQKCLEANLLGTILIAHEGINGMLAGTETQLRNVTDYLNSDTRFEDMMYKTTATQYLPFVRLKVKIKKEIVPLGLEAVDATKSKGIDVSPAQWRDLIRDEDVVLIDNRNSFEYDHGHFEGAIDPKVTTFRQFAEYMEENLPKWKDKKVAMYCTGGIRCEKTTAWLAERGHKVYQLEGGILNYFKEIPDAEKDYQGDCFVFDARRLLDTKLEEVPLRSKV